MNPDSNLEAATPAAEFPYVAIRFFEDLRAGLRIRSVYRNPHNDIQFGDIVQVPVGVFGWRKKRALVVELLDQPPHQGRLNAIGNIVGSANIKRSEQLRQRDQAA
ncbi:hypothetical protein [Ferrimonas senticii]|uniref:hypothetical protein n=1 Tax=Ferrimonas senticii TaxID=394566 RepID=UPI0012EBD3A2|nr:hypothetical protein [Ferrimonas senticii]